MSQCRAEARTVGVEREGGAVGGAGAVESYTPGERWGAGWQNGIETPEEIPKRDSLHVPPSARTSSSREMDSASRVAASGEPTGCWRSGQNGPRTSHCPAACPGHPRTAPPQPPAAPSRRAGSGRAAGSLAAATRPSRHHGASGRANPEVAHTVSWEWAAVQEIASPMPPGNSFSVCGYGVLPHPDVSPRHTPVSLTEFSTRVGKLGVGAGKVEETPFPSTQFLKYKD